MLRRRLSFQLGLVMLLVAFVPLVGAGLLTLHLIERSITDQVRASQEQIALAAGALIRDYIKDAHTKLKSIAQMVRKDEDPQAQTKRLNTLLDPPDIFLEVSYWTMGRKPEVQAQVQQLEYGNAQSMSKLNNRAFNPQVKQSVANWSLSEPIFQCPTNGVCYAADALDNVGEFPGLPVSVPAPGGAVITANLDFRPVSQLLETLSDSGDRLLTLKDTKGNTMAASSWKADKSLFVFAVSHVQPATHGGWSLTVQEPASRVMAPLASARKQVLLWFGLAAVMAIGLASLFAARVVRPVQALARTADALGRGDLSARSAITRQDEIGQLAQAFDRMAAAVQQLDSMKSEFVAHVSHELRTPLTSAKMALANVQEGLAGKESLARVQEDLDRLIRMVNELLDIARIEAGLALAKQSTDLGALVRSSVETLRPLAKVSLDVTGSGHTIDLDAARVQQIVVNLVDNALKYAKGRVQVEIRGREVRVTDDGPGVPPEHRERIFEKFAKVETGPKPPGAGLGLSIARKLAQLHGGSLAREGHTFVLKL